MATVELLLSRPGNRRDTLPLTIDVLDNPMAARWLEMLKELVRLEFSLKKDYCFLGFPDAPQDLGYWCDKLEGYILRLNAVRGPGAWKKGYEIKQRFRPEHIFRNGKYNPQPMFEIHHHFELLIGQEWCLSPFFVEGSPETRYLIFQLNDVCHQIESLGRSLAERHAGGAGVSPYTLVSTLCSLKSPIADHEWRHFELDPGGFGTIYIKYAQVGKTHWEAFQEGDTEIFATNVNGLRHITGQFIIEWGPGMPEKDFAREKRKFRAWLRENGCDPTNPRMALGKLKVGQLRRSSFGKKTLAQIHHSLRHYLNIEKITVREGKRTVSARYPYFFTDPGYEADQIQRFSAESKTAANVNAFRGVFLKAAGRKRGSPIAKGEPLNQGKRRRRK